MTYEKSDLNEFAQGIANTLVPKIASVLDMVGDYESDTFSAEATALTLAEAIKITGTLISYALDELIDLDRLDGVRLSEELDEIRCNCSADLKGECVVHD
jgi:predicted Ser/Thr protein kinase